MKTFGPGARVTTTATKRQMPAGKSTQVKVASPHSEGGWVAKARGKPRVSSALLEGHPDPLGLRRVLGRGTPRQILESLGSVQTPWHTSLADEFSFKLPLGRYPGTLGDHHERVMHQSRALTTLPPGLSREAWDFALAMHDAGKRQSVLELERGASVDRQHELTTSLLESVRASVPLPKETFDRVVALVDGDPLGTLFQGKASVDEAASEVLHMATKGHMAHDVGGFLALLTHFHQADVGAYTMHAGGPSFLDAQFALQSDGLTPRFDEARGRLVYNDANEGRLAQLEAKLGQLAGDGFTAPKNPSLTPKAFKGAAVAASAPIDLRLAPGSADPLGLNAVFGRGSAADVVDRLGQLDWPGGPTLKEVFATYSTGGPLKARAQAAVEAVRAMPSLPAGLSREVFELAMPLKYALKQLSADERPSSLAKLPIDSATINRLTKLLDSQALTSLFHRGASPSAVASEIRQLATSIDAEPGAVLAVLHAIHQADMLGTLGRQFSSQEIVNGADGAPVFDGLKNRYTYTPQRELAVSAVQQALSSTPATSTGELIAADGQRLGAMPFDVAVSQVTALKAAGALVDAVDALKHIGFEGVLHHRSAEPWRGAVDTSKGGGAFGAGFYTSIDTHHVNYGTHLKRLEVPLEAFAGKRAYFSTGEVKLDPSALPPEADMVVVLNRLASDIERYVVFRPQLQQFVNERPLIDVGPS